MKSLKVRVDGKNYTGTFVSFDMATDIYFVDVPLNGNWSKELRIPGDQIRALNGPVPGREKVQEWRR